MKYTRISPLDYPCLYVDTCREPAAYEWEDGKKLCVGCTMDRKQLECLHDTRKRSIQVCDDCGSITMDETECVGLAREDAEQVLHCMRMAAEGAWPILNWDAAVKALEEALLDG